MVSDFFTVTILIFQRQNVTSHRYAIVKKYKLEYKDINHETSKIQPFL